MISEIQKNSAKPRISVTEAKIETKPIVSKPKEEDQTNKTLSMLESIFEKTPTIIEEDDEIIEQPKKEVIQSTPKKEVIQSTPKITKFDSFR
jgi:hypothetical protein